MSNNGAQIDVECDWNYLRSHLDKPQHLRTSGFSGGLTSWILNRWQTFAAPAPQLEVVERISLGPRHAVALIRAEGQLVLVATSADGATSFLPLHSSQEAPSDQSLTMPERTSTPAIPTLPASKRMLAERITRPARPGSRSATTGRVSW